MNLVTITSIANVNASQGSSISDSTIATQPGPSNASDAVNETGPENDSNSDVTAFINDNSQEEESVVASEETSGDSSPTIIFCPNRFYDSGLGSELC